MWDRAALAARLGLGQGGGVGPGPGSGPELGCTSLDGPLCGAWGGAEALLPEKGWGQGELDNGRRRSGALPGALGAPEELSIKLVMEDGEVVDVGDDLDAAMEGLEAVILESLEAAVAKAAEDLEPEVLAALLDKSPAMAEDSGTVSGGEGEDPSTAPLGTARGGAEGGSVRLASFEAEAVEQAARDAVLSKKKSMEVRPSGKARSPKVKKQAPRATEEVSMDEFLATLRLLGLDVAELPSEGSGDPAGESET